MGGGGGWACDDPKTGVSQGFVTGIVKSDGTVGDFRIESMEDYKCCYYNGNYKGRTLEEYMPES